MSRQFWLDDADECVEAHLTRHSRRTEGIYVAVLLALFAALATLPVVRVPVSVRGQGSIRPSIEKHTIGMPVSGFVEVANVEENRRVSEGDLLVRLQSEPITARAAFVDRRIDEVEATLADLRRLMRDATTLAADSFRSERYRFEAVEHRRRIEHLGSQIGTIRDDHERLVSLVGLRLASTAELDAAAARLRATVSDSSQTEEGYRSDWTIAERAAERELAELEYESRSIAVDAGRLEVRASVAGVLEQVTPALTGRFLQQGEHLVTISPETPPEAAVYVLPRDVGLLHPGLPARLLIDAYDHHDWGVVTGRIVSISDDYLSVEGQPLFRVLVNLDRTSLSLRNGVTGELRKGMTLQARFDISERTLWQLLRDDINDWLDPRSSSS